MGRRSMEARTIRRPAPALLRSLLAGCCLAALGSGCQRGADAPGSGPDASAASSGGPTKVKVAYLGLTCEAAMFVAYEKGFFKEEGLDVEFVKTDWDGLRDGLG